MSYYFYNIGNVKNHTKAWWHENIRRGVVTAGFEGKPGDRGEAILKPLNKGDWVLAYINDKGFVGAGRLLGQETYQLLDSPPGGSISGHCHERRVHWEYIICDPELAIAGREAGLYHPVSNCARIKNEAAAEGLLALVKQRGERQALRPRDMAEIRRPNCCG